MGDAALVQESQGRGQVVNDGRSLVLGEVDALLDLSQQRSSVRLLENQVKVFLILKEIFQLNDLQLTSAKVVEFDFFHDFCPGEARRLLADDLDRELVARQPEDAGLHSAVAALAQNLSLQGVSLVKVGSRKSKINKKSILKFHIQFRLSSCNDK